MEKVYLGSPESASMPASCFLPYVEKMSIKNDTTGKSIYQLCINILRLNSHKEKYFLFGHLSKMTAIAYF